MICVRLGYGLGAACVRAQISGPGMIGEACREASDAFGEEYLAGFEQPGEESDGPGAANGMDWFGKRSTFRTRSTASFRFLISLPQIFQNFAFKLFQQHPRDQFFCSSSNTQFTFVLSNTQSGYNVRQVDRLPLTWLELSAVIAGQV